MLTRDVAFLGALCLSAGVLLLPATLLLDTQHTDGSKRYLWVSHRADYSETKHRERIDHAVEGLKNELAEAAENNKRWSSDCRRQLQSLTQETTKTRQDLENISQSMSMVFERLDKVDDI